MIIPHTSASDSCPSRLSTRLTFLDIFCWCSWPFSCVLYQIPKFPAFIAHRLDPPSKVTSFSPTLSEGKPSESPHGSCYTGLQTHAFAGRDLWLFCPPVNLSSLCMLPVTFMPFAMLFLHEKTKSPTMWAVALHLICHLFLFLYV